MVVAHGEDDDGMGCDVATAEAEVMPAEADERQNRQEVEQDIVRHLDHLSVRRARSASDSAAVVYSRLSLVAVPYGA